MPSSEKPIKKPRKIKPDGADGHRQRMFDKFLNSMENDVYPRDVIEMLLYFSIPVRDTRDSAVHLMARFDDDVQQLINSEPEALQEIEGVGPSSAMLLNLVGRIGERLGHEDSDDRPCLLSLDDISSYFAQFSQGLSQDELWAVFFDNSMHPISHKLKTGAFELYAEDLYELIRLSSIHHSSSFILVRIDCDHCSLPTSTDSLVSRYIIGSFGTPDLRMLDYLVVADQNIYSLCNYF